MVKSQIIDGKSRQIVICCVLSSQEFQCTDELDLCSYTLEPFPILERVKYCMV